MTDQRLWAPRQELLIGWYLAFRHKLCPPRFCAGAGFYALWAGSFPVFRFCLSAVLSRKILFIGNRFRMSRWYALVPRWKTGKRDIRDTATCMGLFSFTGSPPGICYPHHICILAAIQEIVQIASIYSGAGFRYSVLFRFYSIIQK